MLDTLIVGGGLAGLAVARALVDAGQDVVVLEARDRLGGRLHTERLGAAELDIGGQWVGPGQPRVNRLIDRLGLTRFPTFTEGTKVLELDGRIRTYRGNIPTLSPLGLAQMQLLLTVMERKMKKVDPVAPELAPDAARLDATTLDTFRRRWGASPDVRAVMDAALRAIFGAEADEMSALHFLAYLNASGGFLALAEAEGAAQQDRIVEGAQALVTGLASAGTPVRLRLGSPLHALREGDDHVVASGPFGELLARRVVLTLPPPLLTKVRFDPPLPPERMAALSRWGMGAAIKVVALYDRPFWREQGYSGEVVSSDGPLSIVYDDCAHDLSQAALVGFVAGRDAHALQGLEEADRESHVLGALARTLGEEARHPTALRMIDWGAEPWSRGCPVALAAPGALTYGPGLAATLRERHGRIHFAGTETAREHIGYMEGALESAERVLTEL